MVQHNISIRNHSLIYFQHFPFLSNLYSFKSCFADSDFADVLHRIRQDKMKTLPRPTKRAKISVQNRYTSIQRAQNEPFKHYFNENLLPEVSNLDRVSPEIKLLCPPKTPKRSSPSSVPEKRPGRKELRDLPQQLLRRPLAVGCTKQPTEEVWLLRKYSYTTFDDHDMPKFYETFFPAALRKIRRRDAPPSKWSALVLSKLKEPIPSFTGVFQESYSEGIDKSMIRVCPSTQDDAQGIAAPLTTDGGTYLGAGPVAASAHGVYSDNVIDVSFAVPTPGSPLPTPEITYPESPLPMIETPNIDGTPKLLDDKEDLNNTDAFAHIVDPLSLPQNPSHRRYSYLETENETTSGKSVIQFYSDILNKKLSLEVDTNLPPDSPNTSVSQESTPSLGNSWNSKSDASCADSDEVIETYTADE